MYKDDLEAARARITTLEADVEAERARREAAEAKTAAVQAKLTEARLGAGREVPVLERRDPTHRSRTALILGLVSGLVVLAGVGGFVMFAVSGEEQVQAVEPKPVEPKPVAAPEPVEPAPEPAELSVEAKGEEGPRRVKAPELMALQRKSKSLFKACYERELKRDESLSELKVEVQVSIDDQGMVTSVDVKSDRAPALRSCVERVIRRWRLPPLGAQTFAFPLIFRGS